MNIFWAFIFPMLGMLPFVACMFVVCGICGGYFIGHRFLACFTILCSLIFGMWWIFRMGSWVFYNKLLKDYYGGPAMWD
jgi:hypothetical protein